LAPDFIFPAATIRIPIATAGIIGSFGRNDTGARDVLKTATQGQGSAFVT
jgi:hypothetical protein